MSLTSSVIPLKSPQIATLSFGKFSSTANALKGRVNNEITTKKFLKISYFLQFMD